MTKLKVGDLVVWRAGAPARRCRGIVVKAPGYSPMNDRAVLIFVFNEGRNMVKNSLWLRKLEVEGG